MEANRNVRPNIVEELAYSTIRLKCTLANGGVSVGTGFVMAFKNDKSNNKFVPVILTNKHVVKGSVNVSFVLTEMIDGKPTSGRFPFVLPINEAGWKKHPDENVDLCALPIGLMLNAIQAQGKSVKVSYLPIEVIPSEEEIKKMFQLDEVVMIGYPDGIADEINNQPIFRRGTFATNPSLDYNGKKEFLIDIAAYNGSSGSPVFVLHEAARFDRDRGGIIIQQGPSVRLVGVLHSGFCHEIDGRIVAVQIPTSVVPMPVSKMPNNLGIVLKAERIKELEEQF